MHIPKGTMIAVADGTTLHLYRNDGEPAAPHLVPVPHAAVSRANTGSGARHPGSSANPSDSQ